MAGPLSPAKIGHGRQHLDQRGTRYTHGSSSTARLAASQSRCRWGSLSHWPRTEWPCTVTDERPDFEPLKELGEVIAVRERPLVGDGDDLTQRSPAFPAIRAAGTDGEVTGDAAGEIVQEVARDVAAAVAADVDDDARFVNVGIVRLRELVGPLCPHVAQVHVGDLPAGG